MSSPGVGHLLVGQPEVGERLQRALALKGALPQFTQDDYALDVVAEDFTQDEYQWLARRTSWTRGSRAAAPGAGLVNVWSLSNPNTASSRVLAVVDQIWIANDTAANQSWAVGLSVQNAPGALVPIDMGPNDVRQSDSPITVQSAFNVNQGTNATAYFPLQNVGAFQVFLPPNSQLLIPCRYILGDSRGRLVGGTQSLFVSQGNLNVGGALCGVMFRWRERAQLASEL